MKGGDFAAGALLSLGNPLVIGFWLGMGGVLTGFGVTDPRPGHYVVFFGGFMLACLIWCLLIASLIAWGRRFITPAFFRVINLACGLALTAFAACLAWTVLGLIAD